jgi:hypothetical protein
MKYLIRVITSMTLFCIISACTRNRQDFLPVSLDSGEENRRFVGWAETAGEIDLYQTKSDARFKRKFPYCVSGIISRHINTDLAAYSGKKVELFGRLYTFDDLEDEVGPRAEFLPRKILDGSVISNFCLGSHVILISSIRIISQR